MPHTDDTQQAMAHTPGPWEDNGSGLIYGQCSGDDDEVPFVADVCNDPNAYTESEQANSRRIVAAVNACKGISTEALELGIVTELLQHLMLLADHLETTPHDLSDAMRALRLREARAIIAKATGRST